MIRLRRYGRIAAAFALLAALAGCVIVAPRPHPYRVYYYY